MLEIMLNYIIIIFLVSIESKKISRGRIEHGYVLINEKNVKQVSKSIYRSIGQ